MHRITGVNLKNIKPYFQAAADTAKLATCRRARCGAVVVSRDGQIVGQGFNGPPAGLESQRQCGYSYQRDIKPRYDLTCCIHAEWRAILDAGKQSVGATLYFMRLSPAGGFSDSGRPFCTVCSRLALEARLATFALWDDDGASLYDTAEYNQTSYQYHQPST